MIKVKDEFGNVVPGLFKDSLGNIVVNDQSDYNRYIQERQQTETINNIIKEMRTLKQAVNELISIVKKNSTKGH